MRRKITNAIIIIFLLNLMLIGCGDFQKSSKKSDEKNNAPAISRYDILLNMKGEM